MVNIKKVEATKEYITIEFISNEITISTRVYNFEELTPQEIVEKAYNGLRPHIDIECDRLGINPDHSLPEVEDEIINIVLLGIEDLWFEERQQPIEKTFRCTGNTRFGKAISLNDVALFSTGNPIIINPSSTENIEVTVTYQGLEDTKSFMVHYTSLAEIEEKNAITLALQEEEKLLDFEYSKVMKKQDLSNACNAEIIAGFMSSVKFNEPRLYDMNLENQFNMVGLLNDLNLRTAMGLPAPESISYYPKGEPCTDYTIAEFCTLCLEATAFKTEKINKYKDLAMQVDLTTSKEEVDLIVW
jgi:hypothetical protein